MTTPHPTRSNRARQPPVAPLVFLEPPPHSPAAADELVRDLAHDLGVCPDDPDGLHHSGCGCDDVDPLNP